MKKILSLVLVVAMMASVLVFAPSASAAVDNGFTVEVTDAIANRGEKVTLDIIVTTPDNFSSAQLAVDYDKTRLANPVVANTSATNTPGGIAGFPYAGATINISCAKGIAQPATEGCTIATITFDVLSDAPVGDAYVRIDPVPDNLMIYLMNTDIVNSEVFEWDSIDGTVTVLPEGYVAGAPAGEMSTSDLEYEENKAGDGIVIVEYTGDAVGGTAIIPAEIDGLPVVEIGATAFNYAEFDTYVFPSSVVKFNRRSVRQDAGFKVYIEADNASFDENYYQSFVSNDGEAVVYSSADATAKAYVAAVLDDDDTASISWAEGAYAAPPVVTIVTEDGSSTYIVSDSIITAPGAAIVDGKATIAWQVGDDFVAPGEKVSIAGDTTFTAVTVAIPETTYGASVKAYADADQNGFAALRFTANLSIADYNYLVDMFGDENVSHGMLIAPMKLIQKAGAFTHAALNQYLDFEMSGCWMEKDGNYVLAASVQNFSEVTKAQNLEFNAVAYIAVNVNGETAYVYGECDWTCARDAKTVLTGALNDYDKESNEYAWISTWASKFN